MQFDLIFKVTVAIFAILIAALLTSAIVLIYKLPDDFFVNLFISTLATA
jgi:hypothetical protein